MPGLQVPRHQLGGDRPLAAVLILQENVNAVRRSLKRLRMGSEGEPSMVVCVEPDDLRSAAVVAELARVTKAPDAVEYWKSAPYLLNFMRDYALKYDEAGPFRRNIGVASPAGLDLSNLSIRHRRAIQIARRGHHHSVAAGIDGGSSGEVLADILLQHRQMLVLARGLVVEASYAVQQRSVAVSLDQFPLAGPSVWSLLDLDEDLIAPPRSRAVRPALKSVRAPK